MVYKIIVRDTRLVFKGPFPKIPIGTIGENNATVLDFEIPEDMNAYSRQLVINTSNGGFNFEFKGNQFALPSSVTTDEVIEIQLVLTSRLEKWISKILTLRLNPSLIQGGENVVETAKEEQHEADRVELAEALEACDIRNEIDPPTDFQSRDWENLLVIVEETDYLTLDDTNKLIELNTIKAKAAETNLDNPIESIDFWRCIEAQTAADTQFITILSARTPWTVPIKIPRLDTAHITGLDTTDGSGTLAGGNAYLSPKIVSFDIDISGLGANGLSYDGNTFVGGYHAMQGANNLLENATFRGCQNIQNLYKVLWGSAKIKTVEFQNLGILTSIAEAFRGCTNLESITGSELNLTGLSTGYLINAFTGCENLKEIRFKADTINANISLSQSALLTKASVLSLINGLMEDVNCTVSLHGSIKNLCIMSYAHQVGNLWVSCEVTDEGAETYGNIITGYKHWTLN